MKQRQKTKPKSVANGFNERQIDENLNKLEKLINETTTKNKTKKTGTKTTETLYYMIAQNWHA